MDLGRAADSCKGSAAQGFNVAFRPPSGSKGKADYMRVIIVPPG